MLKATRPDRPPVANKETKKRSNNTLRPKNFNSGYFKKYFSYIIIIILVLFFSFIFFAPMFINLKVWKPEIISMLEDNTGKTARIRGDIELKIYPSPQVKVHDISLVDEKSGVIKNFIRSDSIIAKLSFLPLLRGNIEIESIVFDNLTLNLLNTSNKKPNWVLEKSFNNEEQIDDSVNDKYLKFNQIKYPNVKVNEFNIINGTIIYNNTSKLNFNNLAIKTSKKLNIIEGQINIQGTDYLLNSSISKSENSEDYWDTKLTINNNNIDLRTDLNISYDNYFPEIEGKIVFTYNNLRKMFNLDSLKYLNLIDKKSKFIGDVSFNFNNNILFYSLYNMSANIGDLSFTGALSGNNELDPNIEVALSSNNLDLDIFIDQINNIKNNYNNDKVDSFSYWDKLNGKFIFTIGTSKLLDYPIRNLSIEINKEQNNYILDSGYATFPGNTEIKFDGIFKNKFSIFEGSSSLASENIRDFYRWLSIDLNNISDTRLQKANIESEVVFRKGGATFAGLRGKIDSSNINGELRLRYGEINSLFANLKIDNLNLDSYLNKEEIAESNDLYKSNLFNFDVINFDLELKNLLFLKSKYSGIILKNSYKDNVLKIDSVNIADFAGGELNGVGNINYEKKDPVYDITINVNHKNFSKFYDFYQLPYIFKDFINSEGLLNISSKGNLNKLKSKVVFKNQNSKIDYNGIIDIDNYLINSYQGDLNISVRDLNKIIDIGVEGETKYSSNFEMKDNTYSFKNISLDSENYNYSGNIFLNNKKENLYDFDIELNANLLDVLIVKNIHNYFNKDFNKKYIGDLKIESDLFTINNYEISDFNFLLNVDKELINLKEANGKIYGGSVNTNAKIFINNSDEYSGKIIFKNIKSAEFFKNYFSYDKLNSEISSEFTISGKAKNFDEFFISMVGEGKIDFKKNLIKGLDINKITTIDSIEEDDDLLNYVYESFTTNKEKKIDNFTINSTYSENTLIFQAFEIKLDNIFTLIDGQLNFKNRNYSLSSKFFKKNNLNNFLSVNLTRSNNNVVNFAQKRSSIVNTDINVNNLKDNTDGNKEDRSFDNLVNDLSIENELIVTEKELVKDKNNIKINNEISENIDLSLKPEENIIKQPLPNFIKNIIIIPLKIYYKPNIIVNDIPVPKLPSEEDILDDLLDSVLSPND